jgi:HNH endonuclease
MERALEELVWERAVSRCEYYQMPQAYDGFTHEIDHVIAMKHGGRTVAGNLALACFPCNNHKGPNIAGLDPRTKKLTKLFNPRRHKWQRHFHWEGPYLVASTAIAHRGRCVPTCCFVIRSFRWCTFLGLQPFQGDLCLQPV